MLLVWGTSLDGLSDIREFIYAYILPDPKVDPNDLDQDRQKLEKMQDILNSSVMKKDLLENIENAFTTVFNKKKDVDINKGYILIAEFMGKEDEMKLCEYEIEKNNANMKNLNFELKELSDKKDEMTDALIEAQKNKDNSDEAMSLNYYAEKSRELKKDYKLEIENDQKFNFALDKLNSACQKIDALEINICGYPFERSEDSEKYAGLKNSLIDCKDELTELQMECYRESIDISKQLKELNIKIETLNRGKFLYPNNNQAERVKEIVNTALNNAGMSGDAKIFCELLQMNDEKWHKAVEVSLNRRRFDIIVSSEHYKIAKSAMLQNKELCRGISLVDTPSLIADESKITSPDEDMLAYKVNSENRFARLYLNTLLYDIHCCENYDDIEKYRKSITPDCIRHMYYRTEFVSNTELYIGISARKLQLDKAKKEQQRLLKSEKEYKEKIDNIKKAVDSYNAVINDNTFNDLCKYCSAFSKSEKIYDEYTTVCNKLEGLKANPILQALFSLVEKCQNDLKEIENKIGEVNRNIGVSKNAIENAENKKILLQKESLEAEEAFDCFCDEFPMLVETVRSKYNENSRNKAAKEIVKNQRDYHSQLEKALTKIINEELIPLQRQYNSTYTTDFLEGLDSFSSFDGLYNTLVNIELEKNIESLRIAKERCKERFKDEILFRLKDDIHNAKKQFRKLNAILSQFNYGEEKYYFEMDRTSNSELGIFYDVIMSGNNEEVDLFNVNEIDTATYEIQIQDLMDKIMADINTASKSRLAGEKFNEKVWSKYADYGTYLDYDVRITSTVTNEYTYLSDVSGEGSGGETQAPFYVAICASLLQIYNQSNNSIKLVLLDEAFSHMTSDRIKPMIKMFKEMQLQIMLIATAEKCTGIQPYCDVIHSVVRKGSRNAVMPYIGEEDKIGIY